jgi:hypothetical protein
MTRRREVLRKISKAARLRGLEWCEVREGANHTVYSLDGMMIPIARHSEIDNRMAEIIYKECAAKLGRDWWRT